MKILISANAAAVLTGADIGQFWEGMQLKIENSWWRLRDLASLFKKAATFSGSGTAISLDSKVWLDCPFAVQGARLFYGAGEGAVDVTLTMQVIEDDGFYPIRNLVSSTVNKFVGGKNYLIKPEDGAVTTMIPDFVVPQGARSQS